MSKNKPVTPILHVSDSPSTYKLTRQERETHFYISDADDDPYCYADTSIPRHMTRFKKQGWDIVNIQNYADGTPKVMMFKAPASALTIGKAARQKRELSEEQKLARSERAKNNLHRMTNTNNI